MYILYVIPGSHACRSAMLMLEHKGLAYRRVDLIPGAHPVAARVLGFSSGGQTRSAGGRRTLWLRLADHLATVPGLASGKERISTNHGIARFLDARHPESPLIPTDPQRLVSVEEVEDWANGRLQMDARRLLGGAMLRDPVGFSRAMGQGRMGCLLYRHAITRRVVVTKILRGAFAFSLEAERELLSSLPATLDRIDSWIDEGIIGQDELNVADFMIVPSLALILYRPDVRPLFEGRPALELVDRLLPEPAQT
jgi:glutathione S-transferase